MPRPRKKAQRLEVYQNGRIVGRLERAVNGAISFQYLASWLNEKSIPISMHLPLQEEAFRGKEVSDYFDNLLPDNDDIRERVASRVNAESHRTFDLLYAIGQDCVGALQFIPEGKEAPTESVPDGKILKEKEIAERLKYLGSFPLGLGPANADFRISIAGAQEKTALLKKNGKWYIPGGATPTTHIFKPPMGIVHHGIDLTTSVENEWLCLEICRHLGLDVANTEMADFEGQKCLIVERFDRRWESPRRLLRVAQEDICQALGLPSTKKYQADGGPMIKTIMAFLDGADERSRDRSTFMRAQIAFFLLAATDGHAKNFSIFLTETGFRLTPIYDVMSVFPAIQKRQLSKQKAKLAMSVGDSNHFKITEILGRHFAQTANACGFPKKELDSIIEDLGVRVQKLESLIKPPKGYPSWILESIFSGAKEQMKRLSQPR
ncbi:MAG: toxin HipA [Bdellovibrio sp.]|nr:MAG: toxin HipA [Bdellovibrio sp.]